MSKLKKDIALEQISLISELCESFFEEVQQDGKTIKTFKLNFTRNFIPKICGRYYGPADAFQDLTFCEYRIAHGFFAEYARNGKPDDLNKLIAVLYRPRKRFYWLIKHFASFNGQQRQPFTSMFNPIG